MRSLRRKIWPSQLKYLLKKKLTNGGNVIDEDFKKWNIKNQLDNICEILDAKINHQQIIDSRGNAARRIIIEYKEKRND